MKISSLINLGSLATVILLGCDSAQFSGGNTVVGYDGSEKEVGGGAPKSANASVKSGDESLNDQSNSASDEYKFGFQLTEAEAQQSFDLTESISNQKNLTIQASYLNVEKTLTVYTNDNKYSTLNYDGRLYRMKRRFSDQNFIDIVMVVDNSSSMQIPQQRLAAALPSLKTSLAGKNWRIILTSTDVNDPCALKVMDASTPDAELSSSVLLGVNGSDREVPLQRAYNIMAGSCSLASIRAEAVPAVFILTNEDECSTGTVGNCPVVGKTTLGIVAGSLSERLNAMPKMASFDTPVAAIAWLPADSACSLGLSKANKIWDNLNDFWWINNKTFGSICDANYEPVLTTFAYNLKNLSNPLFTKISNLGGYTKGMKITLDSQKAEFNDGLILKAPEVKLEGEVISIPPSAQYVGKAAWVTVTQQDVPRTNIVKWATDSKGACDQTVTYSGAIEIQNLVDGKYYNSTKVSNFPVFQLLPKTCEVIFEQPLSYPFRLYVYTTPKSTKVQFTLGENALLSSVVVMLNKVVMANGYTIDAKNILSLTDPIFSGVVTVNYKSLNDPVIRYDINIPANATDLSVVDSTGVPLTVQRDGTAIVIDRADIFDGRSIEVRYKTIAKKGAKVALSSKPSSMDELYKQISEQCEIDLNAAQAIYNPIDQSIDLSGCLKSQAASTLSLSYKCLLPTNDFSLPIESDVLKNLQAMSVTLNGKEYSDYKLSGNLISLINPPESGEVSVKLAIKSSDAK